MQGLYSLNFSLYIDQTARYSWRELGEALEDLQKQSIDDEAVTVGVTCQMEGGVSIKL